MAGTLLYYSFNVSILGLSILQAVETFGVFTEGDVLEEVLINQSLQGLFT
jgi:hypothetical protein